MRYEWINTTGRDRAAGRITSESTGLKEVASTRRSDSQGLIGSPCNPSITARAPSLAVGDPAARAPEGNEDERPAYGGVTSPSPEPLP